MIYDWESLPSLVNVFVEKEHRENSLLELETLDFQEISQNDITKENNLERGVEVVIPWKWIRQDLNLKPVALKPPLEVYEGPRGERFALYKLEAGETIYSHVVLRFTYFAGQQRITQAVGDLLALNELVNVHEIPSGRGSGFHCIGSATISSSMYPVFIKNRSLRNAAVLLRIQRTPGSAQNTIPA